MKRLVLLSSALMLVACGDAIPDQASAGEIQAKAAEARDTPSLGAAQTADMDGDITITVERTIAEENTCLLMMSVSNGTDDTVTAGLFAFDVTGNDKTAGGNMFPQTTAPGEMKTAQIILPGTKCENAQVIEGGSVSCLIMENGEPGSESCIDQVTLEDGALDFADAQ